MPDRFLIRSQQLAAKPEATAGTAESLTGADVKLRPFQSNFNFAPDYQRFTNDQVAEDLATAADFVAGEAARITCGFPFKTSGTVGTAPAVGVYLRGCGMKEQIVKTVDIDAPTGGDGIFAAGESYSATGGKTGTIEQTISGAGTLRYIQTAGGDIANTDVITVGTDTANATTATSEYAVKYSPRTTGKETLTIQRAVENDQGTAGQDSIQRVRGGAGTGTIEMASLDAIRFNAEFRGVQDFQGAGDFLTGFTYEAQSNATLPKLINATLQINGVAVRPSSVSFDLGNTVELDPDPSTGGGTEGYAFADITAREPKITIDPHRIPSGTLDDLGLLLSGNEVPVSIICGTSPNMVEIAVTNAQIRENTLGNRAGLETAELTLFCVRGSLVDNEYAIYFR